MRVCPSCHASFERDTRVCPTDSIPLIEKTDFLRIGTTVGNYRLLTVIGRGGMGTVYRSEHVYIGKPFAVKILHERYARYDDATKRFLREARAASSINHPNIVDVTDFGPAPDGSVYFVMELLNGRSLEDLIEKEAPVTVARAVPIIDQIASALAAAHEKQIVHRDLKPENVMLIRRPQQEGDFVKVLDFGIAKVVEPEAPLPQGSTAVGTIFGTPEYMSPEAAKGQPVDHRADIYSLGIIIYDLITGRVPFRADSSVEVLNKHISSEPLPPRQMAPKADISQAAEDLILKALAKDPAHRQQSMGELRDELARCQAAPSEITPRARSRRLTEEIDEWLGLHKDELKDAETRLSEMVEGTPPPAEERIAVPGSDELPLLLTRKKPQGEK